MKITQNEADKALDTFFEEFIAKQKAQGASARELEVEGNALIKGLMKRFYELPPNWWTCDAQFETPKLK